MKEKQKITLVILLTYELELQCMKMSIVNTSKVEKQKLNYSDKEKAVFFSEVEKHKNIIDSRSRKPADIQAKNKSWEAITDAYNAHKFIADFQEKHRTMDQLRKLYKNENYPTKKNGNKKDYLIDMSGDNDEEIISDGKDISHEKNNQELANPNVKIMTTFGDAALIRTAPSTSALSPSVPESVLSSTALPDSKPSTSIQKTHVSLNEKNNSETLLKIGEKIGTKRKLESNSGVVNNTEKNDGDLRQKQEKKLKFDILLLRKRFWTTKALREEFELELRYEEIEKKKQLTPQKKRPDNL